MIVIHGIDTGYFAVAQRGATSKMLCRVRNDVRRKGLEEYLREGDKRKKTKKEKKKDTLSLSTTKEEVLKKQYRLGKGQRLKKLPLSCGHV